MPCGSKGQFKDWQLMMLMLMLISLILILLTLILLMFRMSQAETKWVCIVEYDDAEADSVNADVDSSFDADYVNDVEHADDAD